MLDYNEFYLYLIRHGQSETNIKPDQIGQTADSPLTAKGKLQAHILGERLAYKDKVSFDKVFASSYARAHDTAKIATGNNQPIIVAPELREYSAGDWTGKSRKELHQVPVLLRMSIMGSGFCPPEGESMHMVERRASAWLEDNILYNKDIRAEASRRSDQQIAPQNLFVFSHGMTIRCLLHYVMGFDQNFIWKINLENTSITKLYFGQGGWRVITINDYSHL